MTQEEFNNLSQRFYKASKIQMQIYECQRKLESLNKADAYSFDEFFCGLRHYIPDECVDELVEGLKERCRLTLQEQIIIHEQNFKEL